MNLKIQAGYNRQEHLQNPIRIRTAGYVMQSEHARGFKQLKDSLVQLSSPGNLLVLSGTFLSSWLCNALIEDLILRRKAHNHLNATDAESNKLKVADWFLDILGQFMLLTFGMISWSGLSKLKPEISLKRQGGKITGVRWEASPNLKKNQNKLAKTFFQGVKEMNWQFTLSSSFVLSGVHGLAVLGKLAYPQNPTTLKCISIAELISQFGTVFYLDGIFNSKSFGIPAFIQSLVDLCPCCGNLKAFKLFLPILGVTKDLRKTTDKPQQT